MRETPCSDRAFRTRCFASLRAMESHLLNDLAGGQRSLDLTGSSIEWPFRSSSPASSAGSRRHDAARAVSDQQHREASEAGRRRGRLILKDPGASVSHVTFIAGSQTRWHENNLPGTTELSFWEEMSDDVVGAVGFGVLGEESRYIFHVVSGGDQSQFLSSLALDLGESNVGHEGAA